MEAEQSELKALKDISNLVETIHDYESLKEDITNINDQIRKKWEELQKAEFLLEAKQLKMLYELQHIYPIKLNDACDAFTIRGLELPSDLNQQRDDDIISSALGYVVHLLQLISKYLEIPLRYQLLYYSSRSMIRDPIHGLNQAYPLFRKNTERERFDRAIVWLKKDVEQVLLTRGLVYDPLKDILFNLNQLFSCELCPALAF
jgi:UV radiation resistance-associated gene protein